MEAGLVNAQYLTKNDHMLIVQGGEIKTVDISILDDLKPREVEFQKGLTHLQWRYKGNGTWNNIIAIDDLKGKDTPAKEIQLRQIEGILSWRQGDGLWHELIDINSLSNTVSPVSVNSEGKTILELDSTDYISTNDYLIIEQNDGTKKVEASLLDDRFNNSVGNIIYETDADLNIKTVKDALDKLLYFDLSISLSSTTASVVEMGRVLQNVVFNWSYNKQILTQDFNGLVLDKALRSYTHVDSFNNNKTFTLRANDGVKSFSRNISFNFYNGRYWGVSSDLTGDSSTIGKLSKELSPSRGKTFSVNCGANEYIYYCIPTRYGTPTFTVGGFSGGFVKSNTIQFTNSSNYTESYDIWKSTNSNLGNTTVVVS